MPRLRTPARNGERHLRGWSHYPCYLLAGVLVRNSSRVVVKVSLKGA